MKLYADFNEYLDDDGAAFRDADNEPEYLLPSEAKRLNFTVITSGYVRFVCGIPLDEIPSVLIDLCTTFVAPPVYVNEADDPLNFISDLDKTLSDQYKEEGNQCFKSGDIKGAEVKYTTALKHNPNNHLIYSNRGYCFYLLCNYLEAFEDLKHCISIKPTFVKGWYRYGLILEKLGDFGKAGIAYRTAWQLSKMCTQSESRVSQQRRNRNQCKAEFERFQRFLKREKEYEGEHECAFEGERHQIHQNQVIEKRKALKYIDEFVINSKVFQAAQARKDMHTWDFMQSVAHSMPNEAMWEFVHHSIPRIWLLGWSSSPVIHYNKRLFRAYLWEGNVILHQWFVWGIPTAKLLVNGVRNAIRFSNVTGREYCKPQRIDLEVKWGMREQFDEICESMHKLGIICRLQSEEYCQLNCLRNGTNPYGFNHYF